MVSVRLHIVGIVCCIRLVYAKDRKLCPNVWMRASVYACTSSPDPAANSILLDEMYWYRRKGHRGWRHSKGMGNLSPPLSLSLSLTLISSSSSTQGPEKVGLLVTKKANYFPHHPGPWLCMYVSVCIYVLSVFVRIPIAQRGKTNSFRGLIMRDTELQRKAEYTKCTLVLSWVS